MLAGRDVDLHALHVDGEDAGGGFEELADAGAELEAADGEHGRRRDGVGVGFGGAGEIEDAEAVAGDLQAFGDRDVEVVEFYGAVETGGEGLDDAIFQHRLGVMGEVEQGRGGCDEQDDENADGGDEDASPWRSPLGWCGGCDWSWCSFGPSGLFYRSYLCSMHGRG